jgi:CheY-like chemotaxis protein
MVALVIALLEHPEEQSQVRDCLENAGHQVVVVNSFPRAMAAVQEQCFDLIISDVHLENGGSVFDFLKWVKSTPTLRPIPFILFSLRPGKLAKYLCDGVRSTARIFGAARYITMDEFDSTLFARQIAEVLDMPLRTAVPITDRKEGE